MRIHPILIFTAVVGAVCVCQAPARAGVPADVPDNGSVPLVVKSLPEEFRRTNEVDREDFYGMYPPGPARPCRRLPIVVLYDGWAADKGPLWTIDTLTGEMDGPFPLPWAKSRFSGEFSTFPLVDPTVYATQDGRFVVNH